MRNNPNEEFSGLFARMDDLFERADRGELCASCFLSPREQHFLLKELSETGRQKRAVIYGGYEGAERGRAFVLPEYIPSDCQADELLLYADRPYISTVSICGSGYRNLTHRDFLGALLGMGIERDMLGDIVLLDGDKPEAVVFCDGIIADFLVSEMKKVANDTVRVSITGVEDGFTPVKKFAHISDTVASARVDCIVAALCSLSREKAMRAVCAGEVEIDFESEERPDRTVSAPCLISIRGFGRYKVNSVSELTKKGRLRLDADKYI